MPQLLSSDVPVTSYVLYFNGASKPCFQLSIKGNGSLSGTAEVEGSHDGIGWLPIVTLNASGNSYATDGGPIETNWPLMRARLTSISGGTATLFFAL